MGIEILKKWRLVTAWHMTDVDNLNSILEQGLLSIEQVRRKGISLTEVGWDQIRNTRPESSKDKVLAFVNPYNSFTRNRPYYHKKYHPNTRGLCLIEIDLLEAVEGRAGELLISNGILSKRKLPIKMDGIEDIASILNFHVMLDRSFEHNELNDFAAHSELLLPSPIDQNVFRRVWFPDKKLEAEFADSILAGRIKCAEDYFSSGSPLPSPAVENFDNFCKLHPMRIQHSEFGIGEIIGFLGDGFVARFVNNGIHWIDEKSFKYI
jgi:hypothetical protein